MARALREDLLEILLLENRERLERYACLQREASARRQQDSVRDGLHGVLLCGPPGCGKSVLMRSAIGAAAVARGAVVTRVESAAASLFEGSSAEQSVAEKTLISALQRAESRVGSDRIGRVEVLLFDDVDMLRPADALESAAGFGDGCDEIGCELLLRALADHERVALCATARELEGVPRALRRAGRLDRTFLVRPPSHDAREKAALCMLSALGCEDCLACALAATVAARTAAFVAADILNLLTRLARLSLEQQCGTANGAPVIWHNIVSAALAETAPLSIARVAELGCCVLRPSAERLQEKASIRGAHEACDFQGYVFAKQRVLQLVQGSLERDAAFRRLGVRPPCGVLLVGPSGCGKSLLARSLAEELHSVRFVEVLAPLLLSAYLGDAEKRVHALFRALRAMAPVVLFIDEIHALATPRAAFGGDFSGDDGSQQLVSRVIGALLNELDGFRESHDGSEQKLETEDTALRTVFLLATAPAESAIDPALIRAGRIDAVIRMELPDERDRAAILLRALHGAWPSPCSAAHRDRFRLIDSTYPMSQLHEKKGHHAGSTERSLMTSMMSGDNLTLADADSSALDPVELGDPHGELAHFLSRATAGLSGAELDYLVRRVSRAHRRAPPPAHADSWTAAINAARRRRAMLAQR
mmetsp:Transcript_11982/g.32256  ORF Transcript_11982/g.32256 Transcript_11982/m.32256 type:complete len:649 (-) Transcript_11982:103-2049(-)|eukprot:CAMPEP_0185832460 /NCGR_PEP_ID=MMETSP1353-20130828/2095_1 /TAXON_ID=1077150 /ORGANISM="Erythrolobus australicus, Strain CCMP3124" /LENGTH=648 /DNA_ID=CAMNT_0028530635 /DNA_START=346 /DNA_END=2292 /DNA_ORIENTATION=+